MKMLQQKRGFSKLWFMILVGLGVGILTIAILAIILGALRTSTITNTVGCNTSTSTFTNCPTEYNVTVDGLTFLDNTTSQLGTAGTIMGVILLLLIIGALGFGGYAAYQKFGR